MYFLDARRALMRHANMHIGITQRLRHLAARPTGQGHDDHVALVRRLDGRQHVGRITAGRDGQQDVAGLPECTHLARKNRIEIVVVGDRREDGTIGG